MVLVKDYMYRNEERESGYICIVLYLIILLSNAYEAK